MIETNFKESEIGRIPHDWEVKTIEEIADDYAYGVGAEAIPYNGRDKYIRITDIDEENGHYTPSPIVSPAFFSDNHIVKENDLLIARTGASVGKTYLYDQQDGKLIYAGFLMKINIKHANAGYVFYKTKNSYYKKWVLQESARTGQPGLNLEQVKTLQIPLPPTTAEQERIADALSKIDSLITDLDALIEKKRAIKTGTMQQLLTGKKRLNGFTGEWKEVRLGDVAKMNSGGTPTSTNPAYYNGDIPFLSISDMTSSGKYIQSTEKTITQLGLENSSARLFPAGTLMYAMYASIGKCSITNIDTAISQAILGFKLSDALDRDYLYYHFCFIENIVKDMGQTGTQSNLSKKIVEDFELTIPPTIAEQSAIAAVLSGMDSEIASLEQKRDKYIAIKQGMMQNLLTGKIRLV